MVQTQQDLQIDTRNSQMTPLQGLTPAYSFGDVTRVGTITQGGQVPYSNSYNANELFFQNRMGLNPFFQPPNTASKIFIG